MSWQSINKKTMATRQISLPEPLRRRPSTPLIRTNNNLGFMQYDAKLPTEIFCESTSVNSDNKIDKISADAENEFLKNTSIIIETLKQQSNQKGAPRSHNSSPLPGVVPKQPNKMAVSHSVNNNYDSFQNGIEAMDVGSLLEQFEEAAAAIPGTAMLQPEPSKGLGRSVWATNMGNSTQAEVLQSSTPGDPFTRVPSRKNRPGALADTEVERIMMNSRLSHSAPVSPAGTPPGTPPADLLKKFKGSASVTKRKTAILLPMGGMPSKGQRGKLFEHTAKYASRRLQKIINKQPGVLTEEEVLCNYYNPISDHDYCQNFKISDQKAKCYSECAEEDHSGTLNINLSGQSQKGSTQNGQVVENTKTNNLPVTRINSPSLKSHTPQIVKLQTPVTDRRVDSVPNMSLDDLGAPGGSGVLKHLLLNTDMRYSSSPQTAQETNPAQAETNCVEAVKLPLEKGCMKENVEPEPVSVGQVSNMDNVQTQEPAAEVDQHDSDGDDTKSTRFSKFHSEQEADCDTTVHDMQIDSDDGTESNDIIESRPAETWKRGRGWRGRASRGAGNRGRGGRAYRKKETSPIREDDQAEYFSKVPSYMTALAKPALVKNKEEKHNLINDNMPERDPSPDRSDPMFDKVPAYYSCFSNSTKYDKNNDPLAIDNDSDSRSVIRPSCSRSPSPDIVIDKSLRKYRSRSRSRYSRRRRSSRSWSRSRSRSCSCSGCESRSRSRSRSRSYRRSYSRSRSYSGSRSYRQTSRSSPRGRKRSYNSSSRSRSRSYSYSRSRSRSYSRDRSWSRSRSRSGSRHRHHHKRRRYSRSYERMIKERREQIARERDEEKKQQKEERRIVYVGGISSEATRKQLKNMFLRFGDIEDTSVHFREVGDNYGFVTFAYQCDAYAAIENSRKLPDLCKYDLCFGGRREFCKENYADLDGNKEMEEEIGVLGQGAADMDFDQLLKMALKKK